MYTTQPRKKNQGTIRTKQNATTTESIHTHTDTEDKKKGDN